MLLQYLEILIRWHILRYRSFCRVECQNYVMYLFVFWNIRVFVFVCIFLQLNISLNARWSTQYIYFYFVFTIWFDYTSWYRNLIIAVELIDGSLDCWLSFLGGNRNNRKVVFGVLYLISSCLWRLFGSINYRAIARSLRFMLFI